MGSKQTPSVYHCLQNHSGYDSDKFIRQSKMYMTQSKLMLLGSDYVTQPGLSKSKHKISFVGVLIGKTVSVSCKVVQRMYTGISSALCLGFPVIACELTTAVQIRFNSAEDNVMWSTVIHWTVTQILVPPVCIVPTSQVSNHGLQNMFTWHRYLACWLCLHLKIRK